MACALRGAFKVFLLAWIPVMMECKGVVVESVDVCADISGIQQHFYHAPARHVPIPPNVNRETKLDFLKLFKRAEQKMHRHGNQGSHQEYTEEELCERSPVNKDISAQINRLAGRNTLFAGFFPAHATAAGMLKAQFLDQETPEDLFKIARQTLHQHEFNPRVWYRALLGTILQRPDLNGYYLPSITDATPDRFLPHNILTFAITNTTKRRLPRAHVRKCSSSAGVEVTDVRYNQTDGPETSRRPSTTTERSGAEMARKKRGIFDYPLADELYHDYHHHHDPHYHGAYYDYYSPPYQSNPLAPPPPPGRSTQAYRTIDFVTTTSKPVSLPKSKAYQAAYQSTARTPKPVYVPNIGGYSHFPLAPENSADPSLKHLKYLTAHTQITYKHPKKAEHTYHIETIPGIVLYPKTAEEKQRDLEEMARERAEKLERLREAIRTSQGSSNQAELDPDFSQEDRATSGVRNDVNRCNFAAGVEEEKKADPNQPRPCILYKGTNGSTYELNKLWYFREDVQVNQHHWFWHQANEPSIENLDRRGEMFYFAHHNMIARYQAERLSNGIPMDEPLDLKQGGNVGEGYNSEIVDWVSGRSWTPRANNMKLKDISHLENSNFNVEIKISKLQDLYDKITYHAVRGYLVANRSNGEFPLALRNMEGVAHLSNTIEAVEELSANQNLYDDLGVHKSGHIAIALSTDPDYKCELPAGVLNDETVAMRDPGFYKIHGMVDKMIDMHKRTLRAYQLLEGEWPLIWHGVQMKSVEMLNAKGNSKIKTFWSIKKTPLEEGVDGLIHEGDVTADICHQHLNHEPFTFRVIIDVNPCWESISQKGTLRIYMAPRYNLDGRRFLMDETRRLMFMLDSFPIELKPGRNIITRNSIDSSSTRPWSRTLNEMIEDPDNGNTTERCGCGWPHHLYIPKGDYFGMEFDLFAMVTNFDKDQILESPQEREISEPCNSPYIFCGIPFKKYPDKRPMGYPFDREPYTVIDGTTGVYRHVISLEEYVEYLPNAHFNTVRIKHLDKVIM